MNPRNLFTDSSPLSDLRPIVATLAALSVLLSGCVSTKYKMARKDTPPPVPLNLATVQPPIEAVLNTVIVYQGPGSWKRAAFWDEYVVTLHNQGEPAADHRLGSAGGFRRRQACAWRQSVGLGKGKQDPRAEVSRCRHSLRAQRGTGRAPRRGRRRFCRRRLHVAGAPPACGDGLPVALPVYYLIVWYINSSNKTAIVAEFTRRRLALPLLLAPGETRTGSLFFPMVPNPRSLSLHWSSGAATGEASLSLESLHGLHVKAPVPK